MADITRKVTIGADPIDPLAIADLPSWAKGKAPSSIVVLEVGSIYVVGEGEDPGFTATAANEFRVDAAPLERIGRVRSVNGTGDSPASDAIDIVFGWDR